MTEKIALLLILFLGGARSVSAQSDQREQPLSLNNNLALLPTEVRSLRSEEYVIASTSSPATQQSASGVLLTRYYQQASLLLHLKDNRRVALRVTNAVGNVVQTSFETTFARGFYELPLLRDYSKAGIYVIKLVIDDQAVTFRVVQ